MWIPAVPAEGLPYVVVMSVAVTMASASGCRTRTSGLHELVLPAVVIAAVVAGRGHPGTRRRCWVMQPLSRQRRRGLRCRCCRARRGCTSLIFFLAARLPVGHARHRRGRLLPARHRREQAAQFCRRAHDVLPDREHLRQGLLVMLADGSRRTPPAAHGVGDHDRRARGAVRDSAWHRFSCRDRRPTARARRARSPLHARVPRHVRLCSFRRASSCSWRSAALPPSAKRSSEDGLLFLPDGRDVGGLARHDAGRLRVRHGRHPALTFGGILAAS